jgi:SAM-dependent methyltransferase
MQNTKSNIDWHSWLLRWDAQQTGYLPHREARFKAMLDVLEILMPESFVALDLACGPGAISQRLLERFPQARCVAVDLDPVLLACGQGVLGDMSGRLQLGGSRFDDRRLGADAWGSTGRCSFNNNGAALAASRSLTPGLSAVGAVSASGRCGTQRGHYAVPPAPGNFWATLENPDGASRKGSF